MVLLFSGIYGNLVGSILPFFFCIMDAPGAAFPAHMRRELGLFLDRLCFCFEFCHEFGVAAAVLGSFADAPVEVIATCPELELNVCFDSNYSLQY